MKNFRYNFITVLLGIAILAITIIQIFQVVQLYDRKNSEFRRKLHFSLEKISLKHEKGEDYRRYMQIVDKDFSGYYRDLLREEFQNLLSLQESISIKDTTIMESDGPHDYLLIKGRSFDSLAGVSAEQRVLARDVRNVRELMDQANQKIAQADSGSITMQLDQRVLQQLFRKAKFVNEMMVELFRDNVYASPAERIDVEFLDSIIQREFNNVGLPSRYRFALQDDNQEWIHFKNPPANYSEKIDTILTRKSQVALFPGNMISDPIRLHVYFPHKLNFILKEMIASLGITLALVTIIIITLIFMFRTIFYQKRLDELKNDFISNMTHEFKTPISTISLACEALADSRMTGSEGVLHLPYVQMIEDENKRLGLLVERILQSAVLNEGKVELKKENVDLKALLFDVVENARLRVDAQMGRLDLHLPHNTIHVEADRMHLTNCLANLLDNAIKYSLTKPKIEITLQEQGQQVQVSIKDQGIGIKTEHLNKVFDRLYRVPTGNVHNVKGFGLGLSYVKSICDLHNWQIKAESEFGRGSTFSLYLPMVDAT